MTVAILHTRNNIQQKSVLTVVNTRDARKIFNSDPMKSFKKDSHQLRYARRIWL